MAGRRAEAATEYDGAGHASLREDYLNLLSETLKLVPSFKISLETLRPVPSFRISLETLKPVPSFKQVQRDFLSRAERSTNFERANTPSERRAASRAAGGL
jgi:hypothetical protein